MGASREPMDATAVDRAAALIAEARLAGRALGPLPEACRPRNERDGYTIQERVRARLIAAGRGELAGWKLGCTTPVMQEMLRIPGATYGAMQAGGILSGDRRLSHGDFIRPGVECEIAVRLDGPLPETGGARDREAVARAVGACMIAAEIVDDRYVDYRTIGAPTLIADDFFHAAAILGEPRDDWRSLDLAALRGRTFVDGAPAGRGVGGDVMGHPLDAVAWLVGALAERGGRLEAGAVVLTGSVVATQWVDSGATVAVEIEALGRIELGFD